MKGKSFRENGRYNLGEPCHADSNRNVFQMIFELRKEIYKSVRGGNCESARR
jgi:hypothetical protein